MNNPSALVKARPCDVKDRKDKWKEMLKEPPKTDAGMLVAAAYAAGCTTPKHGEPTLPVQFETLEDGATWIGHASTFKKLALILQPSENTPTENAIRSSLMFFSTLLK